MVETEERRTLREIDDAGRIRNVVERFPDAIDAGRAAIENLKERLDDPGAKAISERYDALEAKMKVMKIEDSFHGNPSLLFPQQRRVQRQINKLFSERYDLISRLRKDDAQYYPMLNEEYQWRSEEGEPEVGEKRKARAFSS
jgi:hypothetical protein